MDPSLTNPKHELVGAMLTNIMTIDWTVCWKRLSMKGSLESGIKSLEWSTPELALAYKRVVPYP